MAVICCPRHQKEGTEVAKGNNLANQTVKETAIRTFIMLLVPVLDMSQFDPVYLTVDYEKQRFGLLVKKSQK